MGDIILQCSGSNPGAVLSGNLSVFLPLNITNRVDSSNHTTDAVLFVDYGSGFVPAGVAGLITGQMIAFNGINLTVPSSGNMNIKISNVRAAVNQANILSPQPIQAQLTFSSPSSITVDQSRLVVAFAQTGLYASVYSSGITCTGSPTPSTISLSNFFATRTALASTRVTEGFANDFQPRSAGEDNGTRFLVTYSGFPANAHLYLPDFVAGSDAAAPTSGGDLGIPQQVGQYLPGSNTLLLARVFLTDSNGAGGIVAQLPASGSLNSASEVPLTNGSGYAVYEVMDANKAQQESAQFPTFIGLASISAPAVAQETVMFAPVSTVATASQSAPVPRFGAMQPPSDCSVLGDCAAKYFPQLNVIAAPVELTAVAGAEMTSRSGYIPVQNSGGGLMNWTASVNYGSGAGWVNLSTTSGQNGGSIMVVANAKNLSAGTYKADVLIDAGQAGTYSVPVTLTVTAPPPATPAGPAPNPTAIISKVVNAATFEPTPLVAGSLGTLMGSHFSGKSVAVTFDGVPATLLYTSDNQINLQVPASLGSKTAANVVVTVDGVSSAPQQAVLAPAWPSIFSGGVLNQDNSVNAAGSGAQAGSVLQVFLTGVPQGATVSAQIAGRKDLIPLYAGDAPAVPGVQQVNVAVPDDAEAGNAQLVVCASTGGQQYCSNAVPLVVK